MLKENHIGELLKAKRRIRNWSQEHVAEKLELSQQQYQSMRQVSSHRLCM